MTTQTTAPRSPLVVAYGMGVDSTAMLVGLAQRGERPDLILFADTGSERPETYAYLDTINSWLLAIGFPTVTIVKNASPKAGYTSLEHQLNTLRVLPALAYGAHQCSLVWKVAPQQKFVKTWKPAIDAWAAGLTVTQCVGYDAGPRDGARAFKAEGKAGNGYTNRFPLIEWGWDREECKRQIAAEGLPVPPKSCCWFCPAMKKPEIDDLVAKHPGLAARAIRIERDALDKGLKSIKGLGRNFSWAAYITDLTAKGTA
jgi:3'-phosphoadenosine 5'-phosphosulfate sulfotransferase (PAPS reductase)/FAD synthetase